MLIEDFDLMIEARRSYLSTLDGLAHEGVELTGVQAQDRGALAADTRLEGPLFMDWELNEVVDQALIRALTELHRSVPDQALRNGVPEEHRAVYIEGKREAILRCRARLAGEFGA